MCMCIELHVVCRDSSLELSIFCRHVTTSLYQAVYKDYHSFKTSSECQFKMIDSSHSLTKSFIQCLRIARH